MDLATSNIVYALHTNKRCKPGALIHRYKTTYKTEVQVLSLHFEINAGFEKPDLKRLLVRVLRSLCRS